MSAEKPRRLGRGLDALIPASASGTTSPPQSELQRIPLSRIRPNPFQPRKQFSADELAELETSLKSSGLLQPITVRRQGDAYELVAGERRLRAATNIGWSEITAIVRDFDDRTMLVLALVENLQRANLNAIEEARGYRRLMDEFKLTQQQIGESVGKNRTTITNLLRLLTLPDSVQQMVERGTLSPGHARALLSLPTADSSAHLAEQAIAAGWSVRELENRIRGRLGGDGTTTSGKAEPRGKPDVSGGSRDSAVRRVEDDLRQYLQTDVKLVLTGDSKGRIEISFYSSDDLERVLDLTLRDNRRDF